MDRQVGWRGSLGARGARGDLCGVLGRRCAKLAVDDARRAEFLFVYLFLDAAARLQNALPQAGEASRSRLRCGASAAGESNNHTSRRHGCLPRLCQKLEVNDFQVGLSR